MLSIVKQQSAALMEAPLPANSGIDPRELYIAAMYLIFLRAPGRKTAPGEPVDLGEIGEVREKSFSRATPYSVARARL
jgi:hypothetical protein